MTDFRNYIYRLAESVSGKEVPLPIRWDRVGSSVVISEMDTHRRQPMETVADKIVEGLKEAEAMLREPTKTPAGWRYDA